MASPLFISGKSHLNEQWARLRWDDGELLQETLSHGQALFQTLILSWQAQHALFRVCCSLRRKQSIKATDEFSTVSHCRNCGGLIPLLIPCYFCRVECLRMQCGAWTALLLAPRCSSSAHRSTKKRENQFRDILGRQRCKDSVGVQMKENLNECGWLVFWTCWISWNRVVPADGRPGG